MWVRLPWPYASNQDLSYDLRRGLHIQKAVISPPSKKAHVRYHSHRPTHAETRVYTGYSRAVTFVSFGPRVLKLCNLIHRYSRDLSGTGLEPWASVLANLRTLWGGGWEHALWLRGGRARGQVTSGRRAAYRTFFTLTVNVHVGAGKPVANVCCASRRFRLTRTREEVD